MTTLTLWWHPYTVRVSRRAWQREMVTVTITVEAGLGVHRWRREVGLN